MKKILAIALISCALISPALAQEGEEGAQQKPKITLQNFEKCNNWARHYCIGGRHEEMVNQKLRDMKARGLQITTKRIKQAARSVPRTNY